MVGKVEPRSPAAKSGLKEGARIVEVNGLNVEKESYQDLADMIRRSSNGIQLLVEEVHDTFETPGQPIAPIYPTTVDKRNGQGMQSNIRHGNFRIFISVILFLFFWCSNYVFFLFNFFHQIYWLLSYFFILTLRVGLVVCILQRTIFNVLEQYSRVFQIVIVQKRSRSIWNWESCFTYRMLFLLLWNTYC